MKVMSSQVHSPVPQAERTYLSSFRGFKGMHCEISFRKKSPFLNLASRQQIYMLCCKCDWQDTDTDDKELLSN